MAGALARRARGQADNGSSAGFPGHAQQGSGQSLSGYNRGASLPRAAALRGGSRRDLLRWSHARRRGARWAASTRHRPGRLCAGLRCAGGDRAILDGGRAQRRVAGLGRWRLRVASLDGKRAGPSASPRAASPARPPHGEAAGDALDQRRLPWVKPVDCSRRPRVSGRRRICHPDSFFRRRRRAFPGIVRGYPAPARALQRRAAGSRAGLASLFLVATAPAGGRPGYGRLPQPHPADPASDHPPAGRAFVLHFAFGLVDSGHGGQLSPGASASGEDLGLSAHARRLVSRSLGANPAISGCARRWASAGRSQLVCSS